MKFRDRVTGTIYNSMFEIQQKFSNVSFPMIWDDTTYNFANIDPINEVAQPEPSNPHNRVDYDGIKFVNGVWTETWIEVPKYDDPVLQAEWEAECFDSKWKVVRYERNRLLTLCDYTQLPDTPIASASRAEFATYRQLLRDVTSQVDPDNIIWPTSPIYQKE